MTEFAFNVRLCDAQGNPVKLECNPSNSELYTFGGAWREADHVFHRFQMDSPSGAYLWRSILGVEFDEIANGMIESQAYNWYFKPKPEGQDLSQFLAYEASDVDTIPDNWL